MQLWVYVVIMFTEYLQRIEKDKKIWGLCNHHAQESQISKFIFRIINIKLRNEFVANKMNLKKGSLGCQKLK